MSALVDFPKTEFRLENIRVYQGIRTLFVAAGPIHWGSSRMRCWWVAQAMGEAADCVLFDDFARLQDFEQVTQNYGAVVFQKHGMPKLQAHLRERGVKVFWDVCDPLWWFSPTECELIAENVDGIVASSENLAKDAREHYDKPVYHIADRLDPKHYPLQAEHGVRKTVKFIWFGMAVNRVGIAAAWANLARARANGYDISLTVMDDKPHAPLGFGDDLPVIHVAWSLENENRILAEHDVALCPPYPGAWGKVKSNNKKVTAWACGLPTEDGETYELMAELISNQQNRAFNGHVNREWFLRDFVADKSAAEWSELING